MNKDRVISDQSKEDIRNAIESFTNNMDQWLEIAAIDHCQISINFNRSVEPKISSEISYRKSGGFYVENGKIIEKSKS